MIKIFAKIANPLSENLFRIFNITDDVLLDVVDAHTHENQVGTKESSRGQWEESRVTDMTVCSHSCEARFLALSSAMFRYHQRYTNFGSFKFAENYFFFSSKKPRY